MRPPSQLRDVYQSIQFRLTVYILVILLPLTLISFIAIDQAKRIVSHQTEDRTRQALSATLKYVEVTMSSVQDLTLLYAADNELQKLLHREDADWTQDQLLKLIETMSQMSRISSFNHFLDEVAIFHGGSGMFVSSSYGAVRLDKFETTNWYKAWLNAARNPMVYPPPSPVSSSIRPVIAMEDPKNVNIIRAIPNPNEDGKPNLIIATMRKERITAMLRDLLSVPDSIVTLRHYGNIIMDYRSPDKPPEKNPDDRFVVELSSPDTGWSIEFEQTKSVLFRSLNTLSLLSWVMLAISVIAAVFGSYLVYRSITVPLTRLARAMKQFQLGNWQIRILNRRTDEIGSLYDSFNVMTEEHQILIRDKYEQQLRMMRTEMNLLHSQMNPHFLYNTLESIYSSALTHDAHNTADMILHLSRFFRFSLGKGKETFTLEESFQHIDHYLSIQHIRFGGKFRYSLVLAEETHDYPLLKLLLQPLIENAIIHGVERMEQGGDLQVASWADETSVYVSIVHNGPLIPPDRLETIQTHLEALVLEKIISSRLGEVAEEHLFSLSNVKSRMLLFYGGEANLSLANTEAGVVTTLQFPRNFVKKDVTG